MKCKLRNSWSILAALVTIAAGLCSTSVVALADEEGCSVASLNGSYGIQSTGSIVALGPIGPVAEAGIIKFDGTGGVSQTTTVSTNGFIIPNRSSLSGAYLVNPNCTGDLVLVLPVPGGTITSTAHFVIVDHGKEIRLVNTGAGRVIVGNARRQ